MKSEVASGFTADKDTEKQREGKLNDEFSTSERGLSEDSTRDSIELVTEKGTTTTESLLETDAPTTEKYIRSSEPSSPLSAKKSTKHTYELTPSFSGTSSGFHGSIKPTRSGSTSRARTPNIPHSSGRGAASGSKTTSREPSTRPSFISSLTDDFFSYATKTFYTTFTYFTTYLVDDSTSVTSSTEVISNVVSEKITNVPKTILRTTPESFAALKTRRGPVTRTYYTTFTYFTTFLQGTETSVTSSLETITNIVTESPVDSKSKDYLHIKPTTSSDKEIEITRAPTLDTTNDSPISTSVIDDSTLQSSPNLIEKTNSISVTPTTSKVKNLRTFYTTYTYLTTYLEGTETSISSSIEIITSVATETLDIKPTGVLEASSTNKFNTAQTLNEKNGDSSTSEINATPTVGEVSPTPSESETRLKKSTTAANDKETTEVSPPSSSVIFFPDPIKSFNDSAEDSGSNFTIIAEESAHEDSMAITVDSVFNNTDNFTTTTTAVPPKPSNSSKPGFNIGPVLSGIAGLFINGGLAMVGAGTGGGAADIPVLSNRNDTNDRIHPPPNAPGFMERPPPQATVSGIQEPNFIPVGGFGASRNQQQDPINIAPSSTTLTSGFTKIEGPLLKMPHPGIVIDMQHELPADMSRAPITEIHPSIEPLINNGFRPGTTERGFTPIISQTDKIKRSSTHHFSSSASIEVDKSSGTSTKKMEDSRTTVSSLGVTTVTSVLQGHSTIFFNRNRPHRNTFSTIPTVSLLGSDSDEIGFTRYPSVSTIINGDRTTFSTIWIQVANTLVGDDRADTQQSVIQEHGGDYTSEVHGGNTRFIQPSTTTYYTTHTYFTTTYVNGNPVISTREETSSEVIILRPVDIQPTTVHGDTTRQTLTIETLAHNEKTVDPGILSTSTLTLQHGSVEGSENRREDTSDKVHHSTTNLRHKFIIDTAGDPLFGTLDEVTIRASTSFPDGDGVTQTTLSTDDSLSDHLSGGQIPSAVQQVVQQDEQTHFTVAHYYTEMKDHTSSIILDRQETSTDIVTLAPTTILHFHPQPVTRTYFTTYSYYTTSLLGDRTVINSRAETSTRIVTLGPFTESAIVPTATEAAIKEATAVPLEITTTVYDSGHVKPEIQDVNPSLATYYTRYTYFTTYLRAGTQSVTSNIVTYTQIVPQITRTVFLGDGGYAEYGGHIAIKPTRITGRVPGIVTRLPDGEVTAYGVLDGSRTVLYVNNGATRTLLSTRLGAGAAATTQFQHIGGDGNYGSGKIKGTQIVAGTATRKVISVITTTVTETINGGTSTVVRYITPTITTVATVTETLKPILSEVTSTETVTVVGVTDQKGKVETSIIQGSLGGHGLEGGVVHVGVSGTDKETPPLRTEYITRLEATPQTVLGTRTSVIFKGGIPETKMFPFTSTLPLRTLFLTIIGGQRTVTRYVTPTTVITTTDVTQQVGVEPSIDTKTYTGTRPFTILVDGNTHQTGSGGHTDITIGTKPIYTSLPTINVGETIMVDGGTTIDDGQHSGRTTEKSPIGIVNIEPPRTSSPPKGVTGGLIIEPPEGRTECNLYCNANKKEVCRFFRGKNRCGCRAGEARIDNSKQCERKSVFRAHLVYHLKEDIVPYTKNE